MLQKIEQLRYAHFKIVQSKLEIRLKIISYFTKIFAKVTFYRYLNLVMKSFISDKSTYIHIYIIIRVIISLTHIVYLFSIKMLYRAQNAITVLLFTFFKGKLSNSEYSNAIFDQSSHHRNVALYNAHSVSVIALSWYSERLVFESGSTKIF